jgi:hypothetical protein
MGTFLVTRRMSPELRARIEASVRGRRASAGARLRARSVSVLRLVSFAAIALSLGFFVVTQKRGRERFELDRSALLGRARMESAKLTARDRSIVARVTPWLERAAGPAFADAVASGLGDRGLASVLARPSVYVRLPLQSVHGATTLAEAASQSFKDALVLCLLDPPASRSEKPLLSRARSAYSGGERMRAVSHVARLSDAIVGLSFMSRDWEHLLLEAKDEARLEVLARRFERAPLAAAQRAAKAELLLFALDEPGDGSGPTELDGERPHYVRVGLVDLEADKLLFALRRHVDPSFVSAASRAEYASGIDSCALAVDAHALVVAARVASGK